MLFWKLRAVAQSPGGIGEKQSGKQSYSAKMKALAEWKQCRLTSVILSLRLLRPGNGISGMVGAVEAVADIAHCFSGLPVNLQKQSDNWKNNL